MKISPKFLLVLSLIVPMEMARAEEKAPGPDYVEIVGSGVGSSVTAHIASKDAIQAHQAFKRATKIRQGQIRGSGKAAAKAAVKLDSIGKSRMFRAWTAGSTSWLAFMNLIHILPITQDEHDGAVAENSLKELAERSSEIPATIPPQLESQGARAN